MDNAKFAQAAAQQGAYQAGLGAQTASQNMSEGIISRLLSIRSNLMENSASASSVADKIVGSAPTPLNPAGQIKGERPPASGFLDSVQQALSDLERIGSELQEHLNRLHRAF